MKKIDWKALIASLLVSLGAGAVSRALTADSMEKYEQMYKPPLAPPGWIFPVVWPILFILMAIATYLVFTSGANLSEKRSALLVYAVQLIVNVFWPVWFFRFELYLLAFAWLILLWYLIFLTIQKFSAISDTAGKLLLPYIVWVTYAAYLNLAIAFHYWS